MGSGQFGKGGKGSLSCGLFGPLHIHDHEVDRPHDPTVRPGGSSERCEPRDPLERALAMPRPLVDPGRQESGLSVERWGKACRLKRAMKVEAKGVSRS